MFPSVLSRSLRVWVCTNGVFLRCQIGIRYPQSLYYLSVVRIISAAGVGRLLGCLSYGVAWIINGLVLRWLLYRRRCRLRLCCWLRLPRQPGCLGFAGGLWGLLWCGVLRWWLLRGVLVRLCIRLRRGCGRFLGRFRRCGWLRALLWAGRLDRRAGGGGRRAGLLRPGLAAGRQRQRNTQRQAVYQRLFHGVFLLCSLSQWFGPRGDTGLSHRDAKAA